MSRTKPAPPPEPVELTVVVLRFVDGILVDLVEGQADKAAIAVAAERALRAGGWSLPLLEAVTSEIPYERLLALAGKAPPPAAPQPRPVIPIAGVVPAVAAYVRSMTGLDLKAATARDTLRDFFALYDCPVDFTGEPEPKEEVTEEPVARKRG